MNLKSSGAMAFGSFTFAFEMGRVSRKSKCAKYGIAVY
jgi:hypothetical protein